MLLRVERTQGNKPRILCCPIFVHPITVRIDYREAFWGRLVCILNGKDKQGAEVPKPPKWITTVVRVIGAWQACSNVNEGDFSVFQELYACHRLAMSEVTALAYFLAIVEHDLCKETMDRILKDQACGNQKPVDKFGRCTP